MSTLQLKLLALLLMTIDHIGELIPGAPEWFRWIGRLSAPLFLFCLVWGFDYTHDRKKYVKRLYIASVIFDLAKRLLPLIYVEFAQINSNNIFSTWFIVAAMLMILQSKHSWRWKFGVIFAWQIGGYLIIRNIPWGEYFTGVFANASFCEGSWIWILLGILLYYTKQDKRKLTAGYLGFCAVWEIISVTAVFARICYYIAWHFHQAEDIVNEIHFMFFGYGYQWTPMTLHGLYFGDYQWLMVLDLPFMLMYNYQKGKNWKWFFYIYYPVHLILLCLCAGVVTYYQN